jgi:hypothetical protein
MLFLIVVKTGYHLFHRFSGSEYHGHSNRLNISRLDS